MSAPAKVRAKGRKPLQCTQCRSQRLPSSVGRALGLPPAPGCSALEELPSTQSALAGVVTTILLVMAQRQECPSFAAYEQFPDSYRSQDLP